MKKFILTFVILTVTLAIGYTQPPPAPAQPIPIDGGLFTLLLGGIILGGREIYLHEKKKNQK